MFLRSMTHKLRTVRSGLSVFCEAEKYHIGDCVQNKQIFWNDVIKSAECEKIIENPLTNAK